MLKVSTEDMLICINLLSPTRGAQKEEAMIAHVVLTPICTIILPTLIY